MSFQAFLDRIESDDLRVVAAHWQAVRGPRRMPAWKDIDPVAIGPQLRYVWAWKYDRQNDTFIGRLAGEDIVRTFGKSPHGVRIEDYFTPEIRRAFLPWMRRSVTEPALLWGAGLIYRRLGRNFRGERIMMPLAADGRQGDGIIGATFYNPVPGEDYDEHPHLRGDEEVAFFGLEPATEATGAG